MICNNPVVFRIRKRKLLAVQCPEIKTGGLFFSQIFRRIADHAVRQVRQTDILSFQHGWLRIFPELPVSAADLQNPARTFEIHLFEKPREPSLFIFRILLMKGNTDIQVFPVFVLLHQRLFHIGQMNQVQNSGPVDLIRLLEDLCRILQRLFHLLKIFHFLVYESDLHFQ